MADERLIFPLGFDVEGGVKEIEKDWPGYHKKLQKMVNKTPLKIKLEIDSKGLDLKSLRDYNKLTKEAALAAKRAADVESKRALARQRQSAARVAEATEEARIARTKAQAEMAQLRLNDAQQNGVRGAERLNSAYSKQSTYLSRLVQRMSVYFGLHQLTGMIRNIREITAEFELQRVSLGALIQDTHQANVLFGQIKAAAVESPYQIKELVNYTKQLAAYGVEQNKLFDTVMQYADVAAGLGADMSRINLAMGQIRAAGVLKGTELRQLTELGIPMVQLLSDKLSELRGDLVSTGEVFSMISDKAISFKMVEEIFNDLTGAGGRFYNMQQKQSETLAGQWSNMKDTIAIAYEEMGNTETLRNAMESVIGLVKSFADNWKSFFTAFAGMAEVVVATKLFNKLLQAAAINTKAVSIATKRHEIAQNELVVAQTKGGIVAKMSAKINASVAASQLAAANATRLHARAWHTLNAAMKKNIFGLILAAIAAVVVAIVNATRKANELRNELDKIGSEGAVKMEQAVRNFERLVKIAVDSVDGTKRQTDALNELKRTYGDIIPSQDLQIEKLRAMNNEYNSLTEAIREKIAMQTLEQKVSTIQEDYGDKINEQRKEFRKYLEEVRGLSESESRAIMSNIEQQIVEGTFTGWYDALIKAGKEELMAEDTGKLLGYVGKQGESLFEFINLVIGRESEIKRVTDEINNSGNALKKYADWWDEAGKAFQKATESIDTTKIPTNTKLYDEEVEKRKVKSYADFLRKVFKEEKMGDVADKFISDEFIDFKALWSPEVTDYLSVQAKNAVRKVQDALAGMKGWQKHFTEFSRDMNIGGVDRKVFLYTEEEISNFGSLDSALEDVAKKYKELKKQAETYGNALKGDINPDEEEQISNKKQLVEEQKRQAYAILETYNALKLIEEKGKDTDDWVQIWKNRAAVMKDFQQGVEDLTKKMGYTKALAAQQDVMLERGASVGIDLATKTGTAEELKNWYKEQIAKLTGEIQKMGAKEGFAELSVKAILKKDTKNKLIQEAQGLLQWLYNQLTDFETKTLEENLKKEIDRLATAVSRSKEAKDFYNKMLGMTGDKQLSADLTMSVYGGVGDDLKENIRRQLTEAFKGVDISSAFEGDNVDYKKLEALIPQLPENLRSNARKLVEDGIKDNARWLQDLYKTYEEFKTYEQRRTTVMEREAQKRREIEANTSLTQEQKETQMAASRKREAQELDTIDLEEFKASEDWIQTFENIDKVGTKSIQHLMVVLKEFIATNKDLTPEQLKTLMTEYEKLYQGLIARNPLKAITEGTKEYFVALKELRKAKKDEGLKEAKEEEKTAEKEVKVARKDVKQADTDEDRAAASLRLAQAEERLAKAEKKRSDAESKVRKAQDKQRTALSKVQSGVNEAAAAYNALNDVVSGVMETFNIDETSELGVVLKSVAQALTMVAGVLGVINAIITLIETHPLVLAISAGIMSIIGAIMLFQNLKTADSERIIKEQEKLLEDLEYQYKKLEKAAESAFGTEYLDNFKDRLENLYDAQAAYEKQAQAERDKGKQADEDAIKDYENSALDTADKIAELEKEVSERMLGADLGSAARDFADAWLEAYKTFGNTADAIGEKFREMIDNMVAESVIAGVMKSALQPVFDIIDNMEKDDFYDPSFWQTLSNEIEKATVNADIGATNALKMLEAMGINIREMGQGITGISKDIATASEESILGLAAGINTQNFYISQIHAAVLRMEMLMQNGAGGGVNIQDLVTIQNQHLAHLPNISANTASTLQECRSILVQVTAIAENLGRVITVNGTSHALRATLS